jgi:hypothetical protein
MASSQASNQTGDKGQKAIETSDMFTLCIQVGVIECDIDKSRSHYTASNQ